jgi:hypothetical protein
MEPNHNNLGPPTELPQPQEVGEQAAPEYNVAAQPETQGKQMPSLLHPAKQLTPAGLPDPQASQPIGTNMPRGTSADPATATYIADDADLIEKEWVTRAKAIVMQTKDDPHAQNREMSKVKADYLKKRYNKDLKISEN